MRQLLAPAFMSLFFFAVAAPVRAGDEGVLEANVPAGVKASVAKKYPDSVTRRWFIERAGDKVAMYETKAVREVTLRLTPEGKIVEEKEPIPVGKLPEAVRKGFEASMFGKGTIQTVVRSITDEKADQATYNLEVTLSEWEGEKGEFRFDATFDSTGKMIED